MQPREQRQTYLGTEEHENDQVLHKIDLIKERNLTCQHVLQEMQKDQRLVGRTELHQIFLDKHDELLKLVAISLSPRKVGCSDTGWPFLATEVLKKDPQQLLLRIIESPSKDAHILFDFLADHPDYTQLGYFSALMACYGNSFQDKLLLMFMNNKQLLHHCYQYCNYQQVFMALSNAVIYSSQNYRQFQAELLRALLGKLISGTHPFEHSENVLEMLRVCNKEKATLPNWDCSVVMNVLNEDYMQQVVLLLRQHYVTDAELSENILEIMSSIIDLYLYVTQVNERQPETSISTTATEGAVVRIIKTMNIFIEILRLETNIEVSLSNDQNVNAVGLLKYNTLALMSKVLKLPENLVTAHFDINKAEILLTLQKFITCNPWNNMVHGLVEQIVVSIVDKFQSYKESEQSYIGQKGFLAFLIETFKNKKYAFLNSGELTTYGYLHYLYGMATAICVKLQKSENLRTVMLKFSPWEQFVLNDLQKYEKDLDEVLGQPVSSVAKHNNDKRIRKIIVDLNQKEFNPISIEKDEKFNVLECFYEVIQKSRGSKGRATVLRKKSMESPRKKSNELLHDNHSLTPSKTQPKSKSVRLHNEQPELSQRTITDEEEKGTPESLTFLQSESPDLKATKTSMKEALLQNIISMPRSFSEKKPSQPYEESPESQAT